MLNQYLVVYDYGSGGIWAFVTALSADAILRKYPQVEVVDNIPPFFSDLELDLANRRSFALSDPTPSWLS